MVGHFGGNVQCLKMILPGVQRHRYNASCECCLGVPLYLLEWKLLLEKFRCPIYLYLICATFHLCLQNLDLTAHLCFYSSTDFVALKVFQCLNLSTSGLNRFNYWSFYKTRQPIQAPIIPAFDWLIRNYVYSLRTFDQNLFHIRNREERIVSHLISCLGYTHLWVQGQCIGFPGFARRHRIYVCWYVSVCSWICAELHNRVLGWTSCSSALQVLCSYRVIRSVISKLIERLKPAVNLAALSGTSSHFALLSYQH